MKSVCQGRGGGGCPLQAPYGKLGGEGVSTSGSI